MVSLVKTLRAPCYKTRLSDALVAKKDYLRAFGRCRREIRRHWMWWVCHDHKMLRESAEQWNSLDIVENSKEACGSRPKKYMSRQQQVEFEFAGPLKPTQIGLGRNKITCADYMSNDSRCRQPRRWQAFMQGYYFDHDDEHIFSRPVFWTRSGQAVLHLRILSTSYRSSTFSCIHIQIPCYWRFVIGFRKSRVSDFTLICSETTGNKCNMGCWRFDERSESGARRHDSEYWGQHNSASDLHKHADGVNWSSPEGAQVKISFAKSSSLIFLNPVSLSRTRVSRISWHCEEVGHSASQVIAGP